MSTDRSAPDLGRAILRTIDIDKVARPFFWVWLANILILYLAIYNAGGVLVQILLYTTGLSDMDLSLIWGFIFYGAVLGFTVWIAWKNMDVLNAVVQPLTLTSLLVFAVVSLFVALSAFTTLPDANGQYQGADFQAMSAAISYSNYALVAFLAAMSITWARGRKIKDLDLRLTDFIRLMNPSKPKSEVKSLPHKNAPLGWLLLAGGVVVLLGANLITTTPELWSSSSLMHLAQLMPYLSFFLLLRARMKFQPRAEMVLKSDQRPPVLFLRSFMDDERIRYSQADKSLFDFSLESRLAGHLSRIGPFIAVGSPTHELPAIGAARASLSDSEWQDRVVEWMHVAHLIIVMTGVTHWIGWEIRQVVDRGYTGKLIIVFPLRTSWRSSFKKDAAARLDTIRNAFRGTQWEGQMGELHDPTHIRTLTFSEDGGVTQIRARSLNRNTYQLAVMIAEYLLMGAGLGPVPSVLERQATSSWFRAAALPRAASSRRRQ